MGSAIVRIVSLGFELCAGGGHCVTNKVETYLHLAGLPAVARALVDQHVTGIAYELVEGPDGSLPLLAPMSQVAGKLAVQNAAHYLLTQNGGRGVLLGGTEKVAPGKVLVLGAGIAGFAAQDRIARDPPSCDLREK